MAFYNNSQNLYVFVYVNKHTHSLNLGFGTGFWKRPLSVRSMRLPDRIVDKREIMENEKEWESPSTWSVLQTVDHLLLVFAVLHYKAFNLWSLLFFNCLFSYSSSFRQVTTHAPTKTPTNSVSLTHIQTCIPSKILHFAEVEIWKKFISTYSNQSPYN